MIQGATVITRSVPQKSSQKISIARALRWDIGCILGIQILVYVILLPLQWWMQYHVILDFVITAPDGISQVTIDTYVQLHLAMRSLQWRQNERDGVSNHKPHNCLLNREKTSKLLRHWPLREEFTGHQWIPYALRASNAKNVSIDDVIMCMAILHLSSRKHVTVNYQQPIITISLPDANNNLVTSW